MPSFAIVTLLASSLIRSALAHYKLSEDYTGKNFFDGFEFFTDRDPTNGHVQFVGKTVANSSGIAGLMSGGFAENAVYLGMDTVEDAPEGRKSIRVQSSKAFNHGLVIADIAHMPGGVCSTWPAFWMVGPSWPTGGEIDILEGVNEQTSNRMTLHTGPGVKLSQEKTYSGDLVTADCDVNAPDQDKNAGCLIQDSDTSTYGKDFNQNGGGVFATEWTSSSIKIWFFPRSNDNNNKNTTTIPTDIVAGTPDPTNPAWGLPRAEFRGPFEIDSHFHDLNIVFDTTFCGDWAGKLWSQSSCAGRAPTCEDFVATNKDAFHDMFWAINSLRVFDQADDGAEAEAEEKEKPPARLRRLRTRAGGAVLPALP